MASTGVLIASTLSSGGFALLGVGFSNFYAGRRERRRFRRETALELAETERDIWQNDWIELNVHLERLDARLASADVGSDLSEALRGLSVFCWRDHRNDVERFGEDEAGIASDLLNARRLVARACVETLVGSQRRTQRNALRLEALAEADRVLTDEKYKSLRDNLPPSVV